MSSNALDIVYASIVVISFIFALLSLIGAGIGDALDFDVDADSDSGFDFIGISPFSMAMFGSAFGITGLITHRWLEMEVIPSLLWATGVGILVGAIAQAVFLYVLSPTKSSHYSLEEDAIGREAEVTISIPEHGKGKIAFNNVSGRVTMGARSATNAPISTGDLVIIEKIVGRDALVRTIDKEKKEE